MKAIPTAALYVESIGISSGELSQSQLSLVALAKNDVNFLEKSEIIHPRR
jgi:hypothetical protein